MRSMETGHKAAPTWISVGFVLVTLISVMLAFFSVWAFRAVSGEFAYKGHLNECERDGDRLARGEEPWRQVAVHEMGYKIVPLKESGLDIHKPIPNTKAYGLLKHPWVSEGLFGDQRAGLVVVEFSDGAILTFPSSDHDGLLN